MTDPASRARTLNQRLDPYRYFGRLREAGAVVRIHTSFAGEAWLVTRYEDAQVLAGDPRLSVDPRHAGPELRARMDDFKFRVADSLPDTMLVTDPPEHTRLRRLVSKAFTPRRVAGLEPYVRATTHELIGSLAEDEPVDMVQALADPLPTRVICHLLGLGEDEAAALRPLLASLSTLPIDDDAIAIVEESRNAFWEHLSGSVERKRRHPDHALLSTLISARDEGDQLSDTELVSMAGLLFGAGAETTTQMIGSGLLLLLRHPDQIENLVDSPALVPSAVDELLRYESPITLGIIRFAVEDIAIGEVTIPRGDLVFVGIAPANHDPRRFEDPSLFDVTRQDNAHLSFGRGPHHCLGAALARLELEVVFSLLVANYPQMRLACRPEEVPWRLSAFRGPQYLPVRLGPRRSEGPA